MKIIVLNRSGSELKSITNMPIKHFVTIDLELLSGYTDVNLFVSQINASIISKFNMRSTVVFRSVFRIRAVQVATVLRLRV